MNKEADVIDNIPNTIIAESAIHGKGLFSAVSIPAGAILAVLDGQLIPFSKQHIVSANICAAHCEWNAVSKDMLLVRAFRTKYSFINHNNNPNLSLQYNPLRIVVSSDLNRGDELTLDYNKEPLPEQYLELHGRHFL
jgi:hypothetical protein